MTGKGFEMRGQPGIRAIRRGYAFVLTAAMALAMAPQAVLAQAESIDLPSLEEAANEEGTFVWYDSISTEQAKEVIGAFTQKYPAIKPQYIEVPAAQRLGRVSQESMAGGPTADFLTDSAGAGLQLQELGMLREIDWASLGDEEMSGRRPLNANMITTHAAIYVQLYNTDKVSAEELPTSYEELTDERWRGRTGTWIRPNGLAGMYSIWSEDELKHYAEGIAALNPVLYRSGWAAAEAIGAGETDLGLFLPYNTVLSTIEKGAPVDVALIEPVSVVSLYGFFPVEGDYPNASLLFSLWLTSSEGAMALEEATGRGNPFAEGTKAAAMIAGKELASTSPEDELAKAPASAEIEEELARILQSR